MNSTANLAAHVAARAVFPPCLGPTIALSGVRPSKANLTRCLPLHPPPEHTVDVQKLDGVWEGSALLIGET